MAIVEIVKYPAPILKERASEVTSFDGDLHVLLDNMRDTMYAAPGIGLAAPQVGVGLRVAVVDLAKESSELIELINPTIVWHEGRVPSEEGCLSIPDYHETVERHSAIVVQARDRTGKEFELNATGLLGFCIQHEIDHLDGILFIDRMSRLKRELFNRWHRKRAQDGS